MEWESAGRECNRVATDGRGFGKGTEMPRKGSKGLGGDVPLAHARIPNLVVAHNWLERLDRKNEGDNPPRRGGG